jgi:inner membrane protein
MALRRSLSATPSAPVDVFTHALASVAVARVAIPRAPHLAWAPIILAGTIPDLDELSALAGPSSYLRWHHTYTHSVAAAALITTLAAALYFVLKPKIEAPVATALPRVVLSLFVINLIHLAIDVSQSDGVTVLWPFTSRRFAMDWLARIDPWIIAILVAAILLPELLRLVSAEIGSKEKSPRGRVGALLGLVVILLYIGARAALHSNAVAAIEARSYRGESPRRAAAFPESASPFHWHAIAETNRALYELTVNEVPGANFDPEAAVVLFKPESSPALERARQSEAAIKFLGVARFPRASIEKTQEGYEVQLRDLRCAVAAETRRELAVLVETDRAGNLRTNDLVWARELNRQ